VQNYLGRPPKIRQVKAKHNPGSVSQTDLKFVMAAGTDAPIIVKRREVSERWTDAGGGHLFKLIERVGLYDGPQTPLKTALPSPPPSPNIHRCWLAFYPPPRLPSVALAKEGRGGSQFRLGRYGHRAKYVDFAYKAS
jgi:hypothetical protein